MRIASQRPGKVLTRVGAASFAAALMLALPGAALAQTSGTGGSATGTSSSSGGTGGDSSVVINPTATGGNSGNATATSGSTNTGATGAAHAEASSNPVSTSGGSGPTGSTGTETSNATATNTAPLGTAIATTPPAPVAAAATTGSSSTGSASLASSAAPPPASSSGPVTGFAAERIGPVIAATAQAQVAADIVAIAPVTRNLDGSAVRSVRPQGSSGPNAAATATVVLAALAVIVAMRAGVSRFRLARSL